MYSQTLFLSAFREQNRTKQNKTAQKQHKTTQSSTKQHKTTQHSTKQHKTAQNGTKQNKTEQNRTKQNKTEQNRTKQNKTEQNRTRQNKTEQDINQLIGLDMFGYVSSVFRQRLKGLHHQRVNVDANRKNVHHPWHQRLIFSVFRC